VICMAGRSIPFQKSRGTFVRSAKCCFRFLHRRLWTSGNHEDRGFCLLVPLLPRLCLLDRSDERCFRATRDLELPCRQCSSFLCTYKCQIVMVEGRERGRADSMLASNLSSTTLSLVEAWEYTQYLYFHSRIRFAVPVVYGLAVLFPSINQLMTHRLFDSTELQ
jgi:hypothetical protein